MVLIADFSPTHKKGGHPRQNKKREITTLGSQKNYPEYMTSSRPGFDEGSPSRLHPTGRGVGQEDTRLLVRPSAPIATITTATNIAAPPTQGFPPAPSSNQINNNNTRKNPSPTALCSAGGGASVYSPSSPGPPSPTQGFTSTATKAHALTPRLTGSSGGGTSHRHHYSAYTSYHHQPRHHSTSSSSLPGGEAALSLAPEYIEVTHHDMLYRIPMSFLVNDHPGGAYSMLQYDGKDISDFFGGHSENAHKKLQMWLRGPAHPVGWNGGNNGSASSQPAGGPGAGPSSSFPRASFFSRLFFFLRSAGRARDSSDGLLAGGVLTSNSPIPVLSSSTGPSGSSSAIVSGGAGGGVFLGQTVSYSEEALMLLEWREHREDLRRLSATGPNSLSTQWPVGSGILKVSILLLCAGAGLTAIGVTSLGRHKRDNFLAGVMAAYAAFQKADQ